ncbi:glutathione S-transferase T3-like protein [Tanacetum coccineum]
MGGSSSQPRTNPPLSPINAFSLGDLYTPQFSDSFQENTGYWQQPNPDDSPVEQVAISPTKKKKATRNRQKRVNQTEPAPRQTAWTTEEEITLAKGWRSVSENKERGNAMKKDGFWVEILDNVMRMAQESGAGDEDYIQKAMIHYQAECGLPFKFRHCWEVLKDSPKFQEIAFPNFDQGSQGSSKRHKSSGSNSFNAESGDASINLNNTVNDEDDVQEIRRPEGRDKAKNKGSKASGSSTMNDDALARLIVTEMTVVEVAQRENFMELKRREIIEKEIALAKGWRAISENSERGNTRKKVGFWVEVMEYIESKTKQEGRRTYDMVVGKWKVVRPAVGSSKMHKSSGSSSFNAKSGDASINLNNTVDDEDDMQEIRRPKGRDKAKDTAKNKGSKASGSSTMNDDALARLMVTEMTAKEVAQREKFMELKRREVECREREIAAAVYRAQQEDMSKRSWNEARVRHASLKTDSPSVSQGTTFKAVVQPEEKIFDYQSCFVLCNGAPSLHLLFEDPFYSPSGLHKEK